jgi:hypothetical protein
MKNCSTVSLLTTINSFSQTKIMNGLQSKNRNVNLNFNAVLNFHTNTHT